MNGGGKRARDEQQFYGYRGVPSGNYKWRRRRPTPFVIAVIVFVIILLAVIFTSRAFRSFIEGNGEGTIAPSGGGIYSSEASGDAPESGGHESGITAASAP